MTLDSLHEAKRGSAFACQLFSSDTSSVLGILSDIPEIAAKLALGWPSYSAVENSMVHSGPNPIKCSCALPHTVHDSVSFWQFLITAAASHTVSEALRDGTATSSSISTALSSTIMGWAPIEAAGSLHPLYVSWLTGSLCANSYRCIRAARRAQCPCFLLELSREADRRMQTHLLLRGAPLVHHNAAGRCSGFRERDGHRRMASPCPAGWDNRRPDFSVVQLGDQGRGFFRVFEKSGKPALVVSTLESLAILVSLKIFRALRSIGPAFRLHPRGPTIGGTDQHSTSS